MTTLHEAAQQALEALERSETTVQYEGFGLARRDAERKHQAAITALRAALAEPVQEPVASIYVTLDGDREFDDWRHDLPVGTNLLYTAPTQRKPLSEEEIDAAPAQERDALLDHIYEYGTAAEGVLERIRKLARAIERAHGIGGQDE